MFKARKTPLHVASRKGHQEIVNLLVEHLAVNCRDEKKLFELLRDATKVQIENVDFF